MKLFLISIKTAVFLLVLSIAISCGRKTAETKPERRRITETVFATGMMVPEDRYNLTAESDGYVLSLTFEEGDTISAGSVLAVIDNKTSMINSQSAGQLLSIAVNNLAEEAPALKQAEANARMAVEKFRHDSLQALRYEKLYETRSVSRLEYENALLSLESSKNGMVGAQESCRLMRQQAEQQYILQKSQAEVSNVLQGNNELKSIAGGKVYKKMKEQGDFVRRGEVIATIGNPDKLYARVSIDEANISKIKPGQQVIIRLNTEKETEYTGSVTEIEPSFDEKNQSFYCKINFTVVPGFKISGTQLQANIIIGERENVLVIPANYLGYGNKVMTKEKGEVTVQPGFISNEWVEIVEGLEEDETLVTFKVK